MHVDLEVSAQTPSSFSQVFAMLSNRPAREFHASKAAISRSQWGRNNKEDVWFVLMPKTPARRFNLSSKRVLSIIPGCNNLDRLVKA